MLDFVVSKPGALQSVDRFHVHEAAGTMHTQCFVHNSHVTYCADRTATAHA